MLARTNSIWIMIHHVAKYIFALPVAKSCFRASSSTYCIRRNLSKSNYLSSTSKSIQRLKFKSNIVW